LVFQNQYLNDSIAEQVKASKTGFGKWAIDTRDLRYFALTERIPPEAAARVTGGDHSQPITVNIPESVAQAGNISADTISQIVSAAVAETIKALGLAPKNGQSDTSKK